MFLTKTGYVIWTCLISFEDDLKPVCQNTVTPKYTIHQQAEFNLDLQQFLCQKGFMGLTLGVAMKSKYCLQNQRY